ncbi:placenta-expressed transcript 1 protein-like [Struthio camelus]|uniref:placenta-expressed transcript 1 protein-like n=1 Tax=Struthio camelus TaxID=8801 RepID=UPI0036040EC9
MAAFLFMLHLLFLGTLIVPAYLQMERCNLLPNATASNFSISVIPSTYMANTTYEVKINSSRSATAVLLQALSSSNSSVGEWKDLSQENCSNIATAVMTSTNTTANWTSPSSNITSVEIRAYILLSNNSTEFNTVTLNKEEGNTTTPSPSPSTTPNSISAVQSSTVFIAIAQALLLFVTSKLLS